MSAKSLAMLLSKQGEESIIVYTLRTFLIMSLFVATATNADDKTNILSLYDRWDSAVESSSIDGYAAVLDPDVRLILPGAPDVNGRENYAAFLENVLPIATYQLELVGAIDIVVIGDIALTEYHKRVKMTLLGPQTVTEPGALSSDVSVNKYIDVLRRHDDGSWKVYRHAWTPSERGAL